MLTMQSHSEQSDLEASGVESAEEAPVAKVGPQFLCAEPLNMLPIWCPCIDDLRPALQLRVSAINECNCHTYSIENLTGRFVTCNC